MRPILTLMACWAISAVVSADFLEVRKNAHIYSGPSRHTQELDHIRMEQHPKPVNLSLAGSTLENGYYNINRRDGGGTGWIYKSRVRLMPGNMPLESVVTGSHDSHDPGTISIVSFNIQFLGHFKRRDNVALANLLENTDIVVVQELVAPPLDGEYPDGEPFTADPEAKAFFDEMEFRGFEYWLSEEDTGTNDEIHLTSSATEWWVTFYKPDVVQPAPDLPNGFLAEDRSNHDDYERVPYAFSFRDPTASLDFVLVSVHLMPGKGSASEDRRSHELKAISDWITQNSSVEKDFIVLGDMNIEDEEELLQVTPGGFLSLNDEVRRTNTLINPNTPNAGAKPYDHVMFRFGQDGHQVDEDFDMKVINLITEMRSAWASTDPYPGDPYDHNLFKQNYSDHHAVEFRLRVPLADDD